MVVILCNITMYDFHSSNNSLSCVDQFKLVFKGNDNVEALQHVYSSVSDNVVTYYVMRPDGQQHTVIDDFNTVSPILSASPISVTRLLILSATEQL